MGVKSSILLEPHTESINIRWFVINLMSIMFEILGSAYSICGNLTLLNLDRGLILLTECLLVKTFISYQFSLDYQLFSIDMIEQPKFIRNKVKVLTISQ